MVDAVRGLLAPLLLADDRLVLEEVQLDNANRRQVCSFYRAKRTVRLEE